MNGRAALLALGLLAGARAEAAPLRVMSMNACADQIVLMLLPPERIASVTWLSRDPEADPMAAAAARVGINHGLAEEVLRQRPDLVITGTYTTGAARVLLEQLGVPVLAVPPAEDFPAIARVTRTIAAAVGERARGEVLLGGMDRDLARLKAAPPLRIRVAAWSGSGFAAGPGSIYATLIAAAGAVNVGAAGGQSPDPEVLLAARPDLLLVGDTPEHGGQAAVARHPVVRRFWSGRTVTVSAAETMCGTPLSAAVALSLRAKLAAAAARAPGPVAVRP